MIMFAVWVPTLMELLGFGFDFDFDRQEAYRYTATLLFVTVGFYIYR